LGHVIIIEILKCRNQELELGKKRLCIELGLRESEIKLQTSPSGVSSSNLVYGEELDMCKLKKMMTQLQHTVYSLHGQMHLG